MQKEKVVLPSFRIQQSDRNDCKALQEIFSNREPLTYMKGQKIISQGESVNFLYYIMEGFVEYTFVDDIGMEHIIEIFSAGNILCLQGFFGKQAATGSFVALTKVMASRISTGEISKLLDNNSCIAKEFLGEMGKVANGLVRQIQTFGISATKRIAQIIYVMANESRQGQAPIKRVLIPLSQEDIGRLAKTTRVTVTKGLRELKEMGLISTGYGGIFVEDVEGLYNWLYLQL